MSLTSSKIKKFLSSVLLSLRSNQVLHSNMVMTAKSMVSDKGIFVKRLVTSYETINMSLKSAS